MEGSDKIMALAKENSPRVCRLLDYNFRAQGTAFLISNRLLITNAHIVYNQRYAKGYYAEFNYELDNNNRPIVTSRFELEPDEFYAASPEGELDFAIIAIGDRVQGNIDLDDLGYCTISTEKQEIGQSINTIHHPLGEYKRIETKGTLLDFSERFIYYHIGTLSGSSGCPIFNDSFHVIGLHHYATPSKSSKTPFKNAHEGISIQAILNHIKDKQLIAGVSNFTNISLTKK
jgi:endonuclease G, mitochondrial